jgi:sulfide dehydrogenase cytochrome subunit
VPIHKSDEENSIMTMAQKHGRLTLLIRSVLIGLAFIGSAGAADVNTLVEDCASCHGKDGASSDSDVPIIGGYSAKYLTDSLNNYKNKARPCPPVKHGSGPNKGKETDMCTVAGKLADADVKALADHFAAKPFVRAKQTVDAAKAARGKQIQEAQCEKCHDKGGSSADDDAGILAGQWMPYLRHAFEEFSSGKRPMPKKMKPKFEKITPDDVDALVNYFGSFK